VTVYIPQKKLGLNHHLTFIRSTLLPKNKFNRHLRCRRVDDLPHFLRFSDISTFTSGALQQNFEADSRAA
jgi:hypothetical protein